MRAVPIVALLGLGALASAARPPIALAQPELEPPRLETFVEADYPAEPLAEGAEAVVVLELVVDAGGAVREARVIEPAGRGFDEAAVAAARRFRFEPARRDGQPIASRVTYRYVFELPDEGTDEGSGTSTDGHAATDDGTDEDPGSTDGAADGGDDLDDTGDALRVLEDEEGFGATAQARRPPREVTRHTLRGEEMTWVPGTGGDPLRAVEVLPGVGRPPFGTGVLLVRGSSPDQTQAFFADQPVPLIYHFGGLTSFVPARLLERIDFYPGNFGVRYGRKVGGVLDVEPRDPATDGWHGVVDTSLLDASILVEGPVTEDLSVAVGARRSYVDFFFREVVPRDVFDVVAAPVYYDYQAFATWRPTTKDRVRVMLYGSSDDLALIFAEPSDTDPAVRGRIQVDTSFHRLHLEWHRDLSEDVEQELSIATGPTALGFRLGDAVELDSRSWHTLGRAEWRARLAPTVTVTAGLDMLVAPFDVTFRGPAPRQMEGLTPDPLTGEPLVESDTSGTTYQPALYVESALTPWEPLRVVMGLRLDWYQAIREWSFDPRLSVHYALDDRTTIKAGAGMFSQPPLFQQATRELGNPDLEPTRAVHLGLGLERTVFEETALSAEVFYKHLTQRVVNTAGGRAPFFSNDGIGRVYGLELLARMPVVGRRLFGMLSYTLSRSERRDGPDQPWRPFDYDQTHVLTVATGWRPGDGWELGAAFRLVTGNPYTPIVGGERDYSLGIYRPIYGDLNTARHPYFHRLDARVEKQWDFDDWRFAIRLDVQNIYNATNREGIIYRYDFAESTDLPGLPILPSLGIRGEM